LESSNTLAGYLRKNTLSDHLYLTNSISFHWSNWDKTCLAQRQFYKENNGHLEALNNKLFALKTNPVWLCNKVEIIRTDLYALYESYSDSRLRLTWLDRKDEILFSTSSEQGPFFSLTSMKWFNKDIYSQFVMRKILVEQFTLRSFRLNTAVPVILKFDNDVSCYQNKVIIHQISEAGLIFKITDKNFVNKIQNSHVMEYKIPVEHYYSTSDLNYHDSLVTLSSDLSKNEIFLHTFQLDSKILNYYGNLANAKRSGENEFYIFARYDDLLPLGHNITLANVFAPLVSKTKKYFLKELEMETNEKLIA
jgi:hypothetical protein